MPWSVQVPQPFYCFNQNQSVTWDGQPDENHELNCGETCLSMLLKHLRDITLPPDTIHDVILKQGTTGTTTAVQLQSFLQTYCNIHATILNPTEMQNADKTGLVDLIWDYLSLGQPLISLGSLDLGGTLYNHWRVVTCLTDTTVSQADPWYGYIFTESWAKQWSAFRGVLIGIDAARPQL